MSNAPDKFNPPGHLAISSPLTHATPEPAALFAPEPAPPSRAPPAQAEPLPEQEHEPAAEPESTAPQEEAQDETVPTAVAAAEEPQPEQPQEEEEDTRPVKIIWIDVIDTPATRREKAKQKRLEREARKRAAEEAAAPSLAPELPVAGPSEVSEGAMDVDSDLTDLDDDETEDDENVPAPAPAPAPAHPPPPRRPRVEPPQNVEPPEPGMIILADGEKLEGGTLGTHSPRRRFSDRLLTPRLSLGEDRLAFLPLLRSRSHVLMWTLASFPYWPAVVFEEDSPEVPKNVLHTAPQKGGNAFALVRFYEKKTTRKSNQWYESRSASRRGFADEFIGS